MAIRQLIRVAAFAAGMAFLCGVVQSVRAQTGYETEAQRLEDVRKLVIASPILRFNLLARVPGTTGPSCASLLDDLLRGGRFKPVEPNIILRDEYYPARYLGSSDSRGYLEAVGVLNAGERDLGPVLSKKVQRCANVPDGVNNTERNYFGGFGPTDGLPPYRIYELTGRLKVNAKSDFLFAALYNPEIASGRDYLMVDLDQCIYNDSASVTDASRLMDPDGHRAAVTAHENALAVWSIARGSDLLVDYRSSIYVTKVSQTCDWHLHPNQ